MKHCEGDEQPITYAILGAFRFKFVGQYTRRPFSGHMQIRVRLV